MTKGETSALRMRSIIRKPLPPQHQHLFPAVNSLIISDLKELIKKKIGVLC